MRFSSSSDKRSSAVSLMSWSAAEEASPAVFRSAKRSGAFRSVVDCPGTVSTFRQLRVINA